MATVLRQVQNAATALTASEHEGALAHAVVIVHVLGAEVGSVDHQTALSAGRPAVTFQEQPERHREGGRSGMEAHRGEGRGE